MDEWIERLMEERCLILSLLSPAMGDENHVNAYEIMLNSLFALMGVHVLVTDPVFFRQLKPL